MQPGMLIYSGLIGPTDRHAHHAVQVLLSIDPVALIDDRGQVHRGTRLVIPADTGHRIAAVSRGTIAFLDPATAPGHRAHLTGAATWQHPELLAGQIGDDLQRVARAVIGAFGGTDNTDCTARHPAVNDAIYLLQQFTSAGPVRTSDIAARVGLSTSRLTHVFTREVGLPLRRYVLWLRLMTALRAVAAGDNLTAAAHAAGFADSAHLTRTCRTMFGLAPSHLQRQVQLTVTVG